MGGEFMRSMRNSPSLRPRRPVAWGGAQAGGGTRGLVRGLHGGGAYFEDESKAVEPILDLMHDGGVMKMTERKGSGRALQEGDDVYVHLRGAIACLDSGENSYNGEAVAGVEFDSTTEGPGPHYPRLLRLGGEYTLKGLSLAIATMVRRAPRPAPSRARRDRCSPGSRAAPALTRGPAPPAQSVGDKARVLVRSDYAYGAEGRPLVSGRTGRAPPRPARRSRLLPAEQQGEPRRGSGRSARRVAEFLRPLRPLRGRGRALTGGRAAGAQARQRCRLVPPCSMRSRWCA